MGKGHSRRRVVVVGLLLFPLLYAAHLRCNISSPLPWGLQLLLWQSNLKLRGNDSTVIPAGGEFAPLSRLLRGRARQELNLNGVSCISDQESDLCVTTESVAVVTGPHPATVYLTGGQRLPLRNNRSVVRPYPRKTDPLAMARTSPVTIVSPRGRPPPKCHVTHPVPVVVFSTGGFAGNFFHDINDILIPLFLTSAHLHSRARLVITDYEPWWDHKYRRVLAHLSPSAVIIASSAGPTTVHCFPAAVVGLKYHGNLAINTSESPSGISILDFRQFLRRSFSLRVHLSPASDPVLVLVSRRRGSRVLLNEGAVVEAAKEAGFRVVLATPMMMSRVEEFAGVVNGCGVLMGVHGAGLTNMVFLPAGAVVVQVVPWGLDWAAAAYYGRPAVRMGLQYVEYHVAVEESTLYGKYPRDHPVLSDPWSVNLQGYNVSRPVYTDGQNVTLDVSRFKETLLQTRQLLPRA